MSRHGGNLEYLAGKAGCRPDEILDFSANINPLGPPPLLDALISRATGRLVHYPDPDSSRFVAAVGRSIGRDREEIVAGNGTSELLFALCRGLPVHRAVIPEPAYVDYRTAAALAGLEYVPVVLEANDAFRLDTGRLAARLRAGDLVLLGRPNNPTGQVPGCRELAELAAAHPETFFLVDEAFGGFVPEFESMAGKAPNVLVLVSLTKLFAIPGLRLGYLVAPPGLCAMIRGQLPPWSVNSLAQEVGEGIVAMDAYREKTRRAVAAWRRELVHRLEEISWLQTIPSAANFLLLRSLHPDLQPSRLARELLSRFRISIRLCDNYHGLDSSYFRIAVRTGEENQALLTALEELSGVGGRPASARPQRKDRNTPALMLQGTGSDVGKSILAAGLCRILLQDGIRVAPFKAQNMSLNSYVTRDGGEMGRAQVVQAQACRLDPDVRMNPVLLKPSSEVGSQVIVLGRPVANMQVQEYVTYKETVWNEVCRAYDDLAAEFDCIILEGAGSPGEVNLKDHDIVNMAMARYAGAPVLLVGDIDRGGVYASFVGHFGVMEPWERNLLAGFVVNRFRGDDSLLAAAHAYVEQRTGKPVVGVVPFLEDLGLPQEDSVSFKAGLYEKPCPRNDHVEIVLVDLPHISNFTDVEPLLQEHDVWLRVVRNAEELGCPDCLILPGSKNVLADLAFLRRSGLDRGIRELAHQGCEVVGICGGYQMLGRTISDPLGLEGAAGSTSRGLALLDMETGLAAEKTLIRRQGVHVPSGCSVAGYEIHHGRSQGRGEPVLRFPDGSSCGLAADSTERVWGCYLHGLFDSSDFRRWFINRLRTRRGLAPGEEKGRGDGLEPALDRLADRLREHLDLEFVYRCLGL